MIRFECTECGEDCSNAYGTFNGYPYHFMCLPLPPKRKLKPVPANQLIREEAGDGE